MQLLLRFDDVCPTQRWSVWNRVETALRQRGLRALLAVVPDNRDPDLEVEAPRPDFWSWVRRAQAEGFAIGLHGLHHRARTEAPGLLGLHHRSEWAGRSETDQRNDLVRALEIFRAEGVKPDAFVAPGHSFDEATLAALTKVGLTTLSDGFHCWPTRDPHGLLWVPQQTWRFRRLPFGVWTVCLHVNEWNDEAIHRFEDDLDRYADRIARWHDVVHAYRDRRAWRFEQVPHRLLGSLVRRKLRSVR